MSKWAIDAIDGILTVVFWLPARFIGYEKCPKCTIRVRWYQGILILSSPLSWISSVKSARIDWRLTAEKPQEIIGLRALTPKEIV